MISRSASSNWRRRLSFWRKIGWRNEDEPAPRAPDWLVGGWVPGTWFNWSTACLHLLGRTLLRSFVVVSAARSSIGPVGLRGVAKSIRRGACVHAREGSRLCPHSFVLGVG